MKKLLFIFLTLIILIGCTTAPNGKLFPLTPDRVIIQKDPQINNFLLARSIIHWEIRDIKIKYILGMITEEQYKIWFNEDMDRLERLDKAFDEYQESIK